MNELMISRLTHEEFYRYMQDHATTKLEIMMIDRMRQMIEGFDNADNCYPGDDD